VRLTSFTDYTLRSLIYLGRNREQIATIQDIAQFHNISKNHLTKVVHQLSARGLIDTVRGRNGGLRLAREPEDINIGEIVRQTEPDFFIAECFDHGHQDCIFSGSCVLQRKLGHAMRAFMEVLDGLTLADVLPQTPDTMGSELLEQPVVLYRSLSLKSEGGIG
jgi:Rrf2 family nitric oxide-sensitive transcriptional repressor